MDKRKRLMFVAGAAAGLVVVVLVVLWRVSASSAEDKAAELVSSSADLVRCFAGDQVELDRVHVRQGFERKMVMDLPDISSTGRCLLALEVVTAKWDAYDGVLLGSTGASGEDGVAYGDRFQNAYDELKALPLKKSSDQVFLREKKYGAVLKAGDLAFNMYAAARDMYLDEGASEEELESAAQKRLRKAPNDPDRATKGKVLLTLDGKVKPVDWKVRPSGKGLILRAKTDAGKMVAAWSDDEGKTWKSAEAPAGFAGKKNVEFRALDAPGGERWYLIAHGEGEATETHVGKITDGKTLSDPMKLPAPPEEWKRAPGGEREAVVLDNGYIAFPVWRIAEKTDEEKKEEEEEREEWEDNYADKAVQALITLAEQRRKRRVELGIDEDHKRVDGIAYVTPGGKEVTVRELEGHGLAGLVHGPKPLALLSEGPLPAQKLATTPIPPPGQPLGWMAKAGALKHVDPALRSSPWYRCVSSDGTRWGTTKTGSFLLGMRPATLDLVRMTALADEGSHMGCGANAATVALPFKKNRIFSNLLTIRAGEIEGAKIATTAGTDRPTYNRTVSTSVSKGAVVIGWIARGYAVYTVNNKTDNDFMAPKYLAEAGVAGSQITGLHFVGTGKEMVAVVARESCSGEGKCQTAFEIVVSKDKARTWTVPG